MSSSHLTTLLKFWSRASLKKLRNLSLRKGPQWFQSWVRGLGSLQLASRHLQTLIQINCKQQQLDKKLRVCLLAMRRFWRRRGLCLARFQCLIYSSYFHELMHCQLCCNIGNDDPHGLSTVQQQAPPPYSVIFIVNFIFFFFGKFLKVLIYHSSLSNRFIWNHRSHFNIAFMGKSVSTNVAVLLTNYNVTLGDDITILNKITSEDHFMGINYDE